MLTEKEKKDLKVIERRLQLPKWKYVFIHGVLLWGISVAFLVTIFDLLLREKSLQELRNENLSRFFILPLVGIVVGLIMRNYSNKQYRKLKEKEVSA
ncbi:MAG TPA: hypothetical protein VJ111_06375 [Chitinophagaceae bacterium]|nr:hypothetical protein [Chitinophagaceae bacterium]